MKRRASLITNLVISFTLCLLSIAVFSTNFDKIFSVITAPITVGNRNLKNISFMISVKQNTNGETLSLMLDEFVARGMSSTLFLNGSWTIRNTKHIKKASQLGIELANQGISGKSFKTMNTAAQRKEILEMHALVKGLTGVDMKFFMPPNGEYTKDTLKIASELGYTVVLPNKKTDSALTSEQIYSKIVENLNNGDLILVNPTSPTLSALGKALDFFKASEFGVVKVCENIPIKH